MTATANGRDILAVWNDVDPAHEAEYHRWYWQQHLPERLSIPGFMSAYRYQAVEAQPKFFTWYFVRDIEVLRSPRYLERLSNPTDWTQRVMPWFRNMTRCACRLTADFGRGIGSNLVVWRIEGAGLAASIQESVSQLFEAGAKAALPARRCGRPIARSPFSAHLSRRCAAGRSIDRLCCRPALSIGGERA